MGLFGPARKTIRISDVTNLIRFEPLKNIELWERNQNSYRELLELAEQFDVCTNLHRFTNYVKHGFRIVDRSQETYGYEELRSLIGVAIHYYLLTYTDTLLYQVAPEWHIGGSDSRHNWINDANEITSLIGQLLGKNPILFLSA